MFFKTELYEYDYGQRCKYDIGKKLIENPKCNYQVGEYMNYKIFVVEAYDDGSGGYILRYDTNKKQVFYLGSNEGLCCIYKNYVFINTSMAEFNDQEYTKCINIETLHKQNLFLRSDESFFLAPFGYGRFYNVDIFNSMYVENDALIIKGIRNKDKREEDITIEIRLENQKFNIKHINKTTEKRKAIKDYIMQSLNIEEEIYNEATETYLKAEFGNLFQKYDEFINSFDKLNDEKIIKFLSYMISDKYFDTNDKQKFLNNTLKIQEEIKMAKQLDKWISLFKTKNNEDVGTIKNPIYTTSAENYLNGIKHSTGPITYKEPEQEILKTDLIDNNIVLTKYNILTMDEKHICYLYFIEYSLYECELIPKNFEFKRDVNQMIYRKYIKKDNSSYDKNIEDLSKEEIEKLKSQSEEERKIYKSIENYKREVQILKDQRDSLSKSGTKEMLKNSKGSINENAFKNMPWAIMTKYNNNEEWHKK